LRLDRSNGPKSNLCFLRSGTEETRAVFHARIHLSSWEWYEVLVGPTRNGGTPITIIVAAVVRVVWDRHTSDTGLK
jgi:hypothetical protein